MLLFPVKLGPRARAVLAGVGACALAGGCGYRSAFSRSPSEVRLSVVAAPFATPHAEAAAESLNGARDELAREGALGSAPFPRLVIEVIRVDELPAGIAMNPGQPALARGAQVGVTAHGWLEERYGGPHVCDTGDVRRVETVAQTADSLGSSLSAVDAIRSAARAAGRGIALRALGVAEPAMEPM